MSEEKELRKNTDCPDKVKILQIPRDFFYFIYFKSKKKHNQGKEHGCTTGAFRLLGSVDKSIEEKAAEWLEPKRSQVALDV